MAEDANIIDRNMNKWKNIVDKIPVPLDVQLRRKGEEMINKSIQNLVPSDRVVE